MNHKKIREIRDSICKGCLTYETYILNPSTKTACLIPHKKDGKACPCSTCLIKSVCQDVCDEIEKYRLREVKKKIGGLVEYKGSVIKENMSYGNSMSKLYTDPPMHEQNNDSINKRLSSDKFAYRIWR